MKVAIWDAYVQREEGKEMHFDIIVPATMTDLQKIIEYGLQYLNSKPFATAGISATECTYCHTEEENKEKILNEIKLKGFSINELANCN